ncbi:unnamed protein product [Paramecium sonneborni]|uniref:Transmembrane protein n=1 Tax=Paramecium sonneborni TaxID=65129 RepID=A0A8S1RSK6_9CILI|nr:unnamed protein product [Paramecium sonneborni]
MLSYGVFLGIAQHSTFELLPIFILLICLQLDKIIDQTYILIVFPFLVRELMLLSFLIFITPELFDDNYEIVTLALKQLNFNWFQVINLLLFTVFYNIIILITDCITTVIWLCIILVRCVFCLSQLILLLNDLNKVFTNKFLEYLNMLYKNLVNKFTIKIKNKRYICQSYLYNNEFHQINHSEKLLYFYFQYNNQSNQQTVRSLKSYKFSKSISVFLIREKVQISINISSSAFSNQLKTFKKDQLLIIKQFTRMKVKDLDLDNICLLLIPIASKRTFIFRNLKQRLIINTNTAEQQFPSQKLNQTKLIIITSNYNNYILQFFQKSPQKQTKLPIFLDKKIIIQKQEQFGVKVQILNNSLGLTQLNYHYQKETLLQMQLLNYSKKRGQVQKKNQKLSQNNIKFINNNKLLNHLNQIIIQNLTLIRNQQNQQIKNVILKFSMTSKCDDLTKVFAQLQIEIKQASQIGKQNSVISYMKAIPEQEDDGCSSLAQNTLYQFQLLLLIIKLIQRY